MDDGILLFKKHYAVSLIRRDSFLLGAIKAKERFEKVSGEDILRINGDFHMIRLDKTLYITNLQVLERNMGFMELIRKSAEESLQMIESLNILEDTDSLRDSLEDATLCRKMSKILKGSFVLSLKIPQEDIIHFSKTNRAVQGRFKYAASGKILLDTKQAKILFLKLMNDEFLLSELTKQYYEASAKDSIESIKA